MLPDAEYLYACDQQWIKPNLKQIKAVFNGKFYTQYQNDSERQWAEENGLFTIRGVHRPGLGEGVIHFNANSGAQAINLAYLLGASHIGLLGYDMSKTGGKNHWFGDHPNGLPNGNYQHYIPHFTRLAEDLTARNVEVVNFTRHTKLTQFKRGAIDDPNIHWLH